MDDLDRALFKAWHELAAKLEGNPAEVERRLLRRRRALAKNSRAWSLAIRATDRRINPCNSTYFPGDRLAAARRPHKIRIDAAMLRKLCAPVWLKWPGVHIDEAARLMGCCPTIIRSWAKKRFLQTAKGDGHRGRFKLAVWAPGPLDPGNDRGAPPHRLWGTLWQSMHKDIPDDFEAVVTRIPLWEKNGQFFGWRFLCPVCTPAPASLFGIDPEARDADDPYKAELEAWLGNPHARLQRSESAEKWWGELEHELRPCSVDKLYLPMKPWRLEDVTGLPGAIVDLAARAEGGGLTPWVFACRDCHRIEFGRLAHKWEWNGIVSVFSGGLLYGQEVAMPEGMIERWHLGRRLKHPKEDAVLECVRQGLSYAEIGAKLGLTQPAQLAAKGYRRHRVNSRTEYLALQGIRAPVFLTRKQRELVGLVAQGLTYTQMSKILGVTPPNLFPRLRLLWRMLGVKGIRELRVAVQEREDVRAGRVAG